MRLAPPVYPSLPKLTLVIAMAVCLAAPACSSASRSADERNESAQGVRDRADDGFRDLDRRTGNQEAAQPRDVDTMPDWIVSPPNTPGYYFGTGVGNYRSATHIALAMQEATTGARRSLADTIRTNVQAAFQRYMESVVTADGQIVEESLTRDVSRAVTDHVLMGAEIIDFARMSDPGTQGHVLFALARISQENVARSMQEQAQRELEGRTVRFEDIEAALMDGLRGPSPSELRRQPGSTVQDMFTTGSTRTGNGSSGASGFPTGGGPSGFPTAGGHTTQPGDAPAPARTTNAERVRMWIEDRRDTEYSAAEYLIGTGVGSTIDGAIASARQDLVGFFETELVGVTTVVSESWHRMHGEAQQVRESMHQMSTLRQTIAGTLHGARVAGTGDYRGQPAALVVLNRQDFLTFAGNAINQREREIGDALSSAKGMIDQRRYIDAMRAIAPAYRLQAEIRTLISQHNLLTREQRSPAFTEAQIEDVLRRIGESLTVMLRLDVEITHENRRTERADAGQIIDDLQRALTTERSGLTVRQTSAALTRASLAQIGRSSHDEIASMADDAAFVVYGRIQVSFNQTVHGRLNEYTAVYDLTIVETSTGQTWRVADQSGRNARGQAQSAREAAGTSLQRAASRIAYEMVDLFARSR